MRVSGAAALIPILFATFGLLSPALGCGGGQGPASASPSARQDGTRRPEVLKSEGCDESGRRVELLDLYGDRKAGTRKVMGAGAGPELCRSIDLNHDGKTDLIEYYDGSGKVRRREYFLGDDGQVTQIEYYEGGRLVRRESDTMQRRKIDTWDWFDASTPLDAKTGRPKHPVRRERDTSGNGRIDEWWTWDGEKVTISVDSNGDGQPEPTSAVTLGGNGKPMSAGSAGGAPRPATTDGGTTTTLVAADSGDATATASLSAVAMDGGAP